MCNDAVRIAVREKPRNKFKLIELAYPRLKEYGLQSHYALSACEVAFSVYRNKNRRSIPYISKSFIKLDNQSYRLNHFLLRVPTKPRNSLFLALDGSTYHLSFIDDPNLKRGSVIINEQTVSVAFSREVERFNPVGFIGMDTNERNVTVSATDGWHKRFTELGEVAEVKERYRLIRARIAMEIKGDRRIGKQLLAKYGRRERNRTASRLHNVSKRIVSYAKEQHLGIKMEKLTGIRKLYRRGNGQARSFRGRMNSWAFGEVQRQIDYKSKWDGVPVYRVNPLGTSSYCLCGSRVAPLADRKLRCPRCNIIWDRDDLASKRIMACAVPQARPSKGSRRGIPDA
jgi:putative transposase